LTSAWDSEDARKDPAFASLQGAAAFPAILDEQAVYSPFLKFFWQTVLRFVNKKADEDPQFVNSRRGKLDCYFRFRSTDRN